MTEPATDQAEADDRYMVPGLVRGLQVLESFSAERPELSLSDLGRELGISRSSAYRIAYTLAELGFLVRDPQSKAYRPGPRVLALGFAWLAAQELLDVARPRLAQLRDDTGCAAHLAVLEEREIIYLLRLPAQSTLTSNIHVGTRMPAHATSMGRAILSSLPPDRVAALYDGVVLEAATRQTATTLKALHKQLSADRAAGCVVSHAAYEAGISSVAAALFDASGTPVGAINISTPEATMPARQLEGPVRDAVVAAASDISGLLGHLPARKTG